MKPINSLSAIITSVLLGIFVFTHYAFSAAEVSPTPPAWRPIHKVLVMGNSLTIHGPSTEKLGWPHHFGMAATKAENDYAHQLYHNILKAQQPSQHRPQLKVMSLLATNIHIPPEAVQYGADYIVLQIGDNLPAAKATSENFVKPYVQLVQALQEACPQSRIFITSLWGGEAKRNDMVQQVCAATSATFVDLRPIAGDPQNRAAAEDVYQNPGVRWHPGDRGMKAIADAIWQQTLATAKSDGSKKSHQKTHE